MHDIFISYAKEDKASAMKIARVLDQKGFNVWWDIDIPTGSTFDAVIEKAVADSKCVVVLWSEHSVNSEWVRIEAAEGRERDILIPVLIDQVDIPFAFRRRQTLDLSEWVRGKKDNTIDRLIADVDYLLNREEQPSSQEEKTPQKNPARDSKDHSEKNKRSFQKYIKISVILVIIAGLVYFSSSIITGKNQDVQIGDLYENGIVFDLDPNGNYIKICAQKDLGFLNWYEAKSTSEDYEVNGIDDWYLPSREELKLMFQNLASNEKANFKKEWYWSSSESDGNAWEMHFSDGFEQNDGGGNESLSFVRPIRTIKLNSLKIGDSHAGGIIFQLDAGGEHGKVCSEIDLGSYNWYEAKKVCEDYSAGGYDDWYLPSKEELNLIYNNLSEKGLLKFLDDWYWSATETDGQGWEQDFEGGYQQNDGGGNESYSSVRAIRSF